MQHVSRTAPASSSVPSSAFPVRESLLCIVTPYILRAAIRARHLYGYQLIPALTSMSGKVFSAIAVVVFFCRSRVVVPFEQSHRMSIVTPRFAHASTSVAFQGTVDSSLCIFARSTRVLRACRPIIVTKVFLYRFVEGEGVHAQVRPNRDAVRAHASALYTVLGSGMSIVTRAPSSRDMRAYR